MRAKEGEAGGDIGGARKVLRGGSISAERED